MTSEVRVGALFFLGLGLAVWFTFFVTGIGRPKGRYAVRFVKVLQLKDGDPVDYNGVRVGTVAGVEPDIAPDGVPMVKVTFSIDKAMRDRVLVDQSTHYRIGAGLLGGAYLDIASSSGKPITDNALAGVVGETPVAIADAVNSVYTLIEENRKSINEAMLSLRDGIKQFSSAMGEIQGLVKENREQVQKTVHSIGDMADNITKLVADNREQIRQMIMHIDVATKQVGEMVGENRQDLHKAMAQVPDTVAAIRDAARRIEKTLADNSDDVHTAIAKLADFAPKLDRIGANLEVITTQIASGKGSMGKLVFEDTLHDKTVQAVDNFNQRLEEVKPFTSGISDLKLFAGLDVGANTNTGAGTGRAYLRLEPRPWKYYQAGVSYRTAGDRNGVKGDDPNKLNVDLNLELGWRFIPSDHLERYWLTVAGGLIDTEPGVRFEVPIGRDDLLLRGLVRKKDNSRDTDDRRYEKGNVMARATIEWQPFSRWRVWLVAGGDDLVDKPAPWVGIRGELLDNDLRNLTTISGVSR